VAGAAVGEGELEVLELAVVARVLEAATNSLDWNKMEEILRLRGS
jgi:hypothetical protein